MKRNETLRGDMLGIAQKSFPLDRATNLDARDGIGCTRSHFLSKRSVIGQAIETSLIWSHVDQHWRPTQLTTCHVDRAVSRGLRPAFSGHGISSKVRIAWSEARSCHCLGDTKRIDLLNQFRAHRRCPFGLKREAAHGIAKVDLGQAFACSRNCSTRD